MTWIPANDMPDQTGTVAVDATADPAVRFRAMWHGVHAHLAADPDRARFLIQVEASPYATEAHAAAMGRDDDELLVAAAAPDLAALLADLPPEVQYDLGLAPAVRLVARGDQLDAATLDRVATACWRGPTTG